MKDKVDELNELIDRLEDEVKKLVSTNRDLVEKNLSLQDEVDSLWLMMDEMTKSDIENWSSLLESIEEDVALRALMVTKKKAKC
jgi:cell division septum initiation protein DivIVA|tara:strand:+ start:347 stop:598 length:252 start_codon:yes stop_codon:yes gene_type:complete